MTQLWCSTHDNRERPTWLYKMQNDTLYQIHREWLKNGLKEWTQTDAELRHVNKDLVSVTFPRHGDVGPIGFSITRYEANNDL